MKKNILIVVIFVILLGFLGGCCPTCPQEEWTVTIIGEKPYCCDYDYNNNDCLGDYFLNDMRIVAPWAYPRSCAQEQPQFASLADTQRVVDDVYLSKDIISAFKEYPNCSKIPLGHAYYSNGSKLFIVATMNSQGQVEFYMIVGDQLFRVYEDYNITAIEFF